jgi:hypothetical protein
MVSFSELPRLRLELAPALPLDARVRTVTVGGRAAKFNLRSEGDVQRVQLTVEMTRGADVVIKYDEGTEVYHEAQAPAPGARSGGLRVLRSRADERSLRLLVEGRGGYAYSLSVRTPREIGEAAGVKVIRHPGRDAMLAFSFDGPKDTYVRRELVIPLGRAK